MKSAPEKTSVPDPGRGRQQLGQGPESGRPVTKSRRQALRVRARRRCRPQRDCDACDDGSGEGKRQPRPPPAELADRSDQRHADDPGGRRADQRPRQRPGALLLRNPLGGGDRSADQEAGDGEPEEKLGDQEDGERRRGGAQSRCGRQPECPAGDHATQWNPAGEGAECDRRQARGQAGRRAQLACGGRRDVEIRGHLRQHGCQRDHARLSREQAEEERDPDRSLGPSPPIRRCRHCSHPQGIVPPRRPLGNGAGPCLVVRPATPLSGTRLWPRRGQYAGKFGKKQWSSMAFEVQLEQAGRGPAVRRTAAGNTGPVRASTPTASRRLDQRHLRGFRGLRVR